MSDPYILHKSGAEIKEEITVKQITLEQVRKGERFVLDGVAFVKLDEDREKLLLVVFPCNSQNPKRSKRREGRRLSGIK